MNVTTSKSLTNITPYELELSRGQGAYSVGIFKDRLYLAEIYIYVDTDQEREFSRIVRYNPEVGGWQEIYSAFLSSKEEPETLPDDSIEQKDNPVLESEMIRFPGDGKVPEALYLRFVTPSREQLLRTEDGDHFQVVDPLPIGLPELFSRRRFRLFQDHLYSLSALGSDRDLEIEDPCLIHLATPWEGVSGQAANLPGFGDTTNSGISELVAFQDRLYAATVNQEKGFQIWQTDGQGTLPHNWKLILSQGGYRFSLNQWVSSFVPFKGDLYLASGLYLERGKEQLNLFYPAGFEILRFYPDNTWDILVGMPKFTKDGLKVPLSAMGPGFDDPYNCSVQCFAAQGDSLYLGTHNLDRFQFWHSEDGEIWEQLVLGDEFSAYYQIEAREAFSTSWGLILVLDRVEPNGSKQRQLYLV